MTSSLRRPFVFVLGTVVLFGAGTARAGDLKRAIAIQTLLTEAKKFKGFDDPKTTLQEALDALSKSQDVTIHINEKAFREEEVMGVQNTPIADPNSIPEFTGTLSVMLGKLLAKVPVPSGATFLVRDDAIEITTNKALRREFYRGRPAKGPLPPLVHAEITGVPLAVALRDLVRAHGGNIVVDARAAKEAGTMVTAELTNVPLDTAVALLADMSGLTTVDVGNVIYVTTKDNARALQLEQERRRLNAQKMTDPTK
jgi:hypothetical protein